MASERHAITEYGAETGEEVTEAFRAAVAACERTGGGTVHVPPGDYEVGAVNLVDDLTVHLAPGAVVHASGDSDDYDLSAEYEEPDGERPLFVARACQNVTLAGDGTVDGHGTDIMEMDEPIRSHSGQSSEYPLVSDGRPRPRQGDAFLDPASGTDDWPVAKPQFRPGPIVLFDDCTDVAVRDVTLRDMPAWTLAIRNSEAINVRGVDVRNHMRIPNCDGLSIAGSRDVRVSDCTIRCCDDAITLVSRTAEAACEHVTVTNCILSSRACAVKIGSETAGPIRNCTVANCVVTGSNRGLGIQHRDGGTVENVVFSDVRVETHLFEGPWWGKAEPIYVTSVPRDADTDLGAVRNVRFSNLTAQCENGALVYGHANATLEDIRLEAVRLDIRGSDAAEAVGGNFDLQPTGVVPPIFEHDIPALHCENVSDLTIDDFAVEWGDDCPAYYTHAVDCVDIDGLVVDRFDGRPVRDKSGLAAISARDSSTISVRDSRARPGTGTFFLASGTDDERVFAGNDLVDADRFVVGDVEFTTADFGL